MANPFKPQPHEQAILNKSRYPHADELKPLSVKNSHGQTMLLLPTAALAFEQANRDFSKKYGRPIQVNSAYRSVEEQQRLYNQLHGKQAVAVPGHSTHNYGFALDVQEYHLARPFLEAVGFIWRNFFNDPWHFDFKGQP